MNTTIATAVILVLALVTMFPPSGANEEERALILETRAEGYRNALQTVFSQMVSVDVAGGGNENLSSFRTRRLLQEVSTEVSIEVSEGGPACGSCCSCPRRCCDVHYCRNHANCR